MEVFLHYFTAQNSQNLLSNNYRVNFTYKVVYLHYFTTKINPNALRKKMKNWILNFTSKVVYLHYLQFKGELNHEFCFKSGIYLHYFTTQTNLKGIYIL